MRWDEVGARPWVAAGEAEHVVLHVLLRGAALEIPMEGQPFQLNVATAQLAVEGSLALEGFDGRFRFGAARGDLAGDRLEMVEGRLHAGLSVAGPSSDLTVQADGTAKRLLGAGRTVGPGPAAPEYGPAWGPAAAVPASLALAVAVLAVWQVGRRRSGSGLRILERAQADLMGGHYRRAAWRSRRAMRQGPTADAALIHASSLLKAGRSEASVRFLRTIREQVPDPSGVLAVLHSIGEMESGRFDTAMRELACAVDAHPGLVGELQGTRLQALARHHPTTRRYFREPEESSIT